MVKIVYLQPKLSAMQIDWAMASLPVGVDDDKEDLPYKRIQRPLFSFDKNMKDPDISARLISESELND